MGRVATNHVGEVRDLVRELSTMIRFSLTVGMLSGIEDRLIEYALSVPDFPTAIKEFEWRNGYFYGKSVVAKENGFPDQTPMHTYVFNSF